TSGHEGRLPVERMLAHKDQPVTPPIMPKADLGSRLAEGPRPHSDITLPRLPENLLHNNSGDTQPPESINTDPPLAEAPTGTVAQADGTRNGSPIIPPSIDPDRNDKFERVPGLAPPAGKANSGESAQLAMNGSRQRAGNSGPELHTDKDVASTESHKTK